MRNRVLEVVLPPDVYRKLSALAEAEVRDPAQQAIFMIKQAVESTPAPNPEATDRRELAEAHK